MVEELLPALVAVVTQVDVDERIMLRFNRLFNKLHTGAAGDSAALPDVAGGTCANNIFPRRFAAHGSRDNVVERKLAGRKTSAAILAPVLVACEDISAIELHFVSRQAVVEQQPNNSRHGDIKIHRRNPVVPVRLETASELAHLAPALEIVVGILALVERNHLGQVPKQQRKRPPGSNDTDGHIMFIQDKDIAVQSRLAITGKHNLKIVSLNYHSVLYTTTIRLYIPYLLKPYISQHITNYY